MYCTAYLLPGIYQLMRMIRYNPADEIHDHYKLEPQNEIKEFAICGTPCCPIRKREFAFVPRMVRFQPTTKDAQQQPRW